MMAKDLKNLEDDVDDQDALEGLNSEEDTLPSDESDADSELELPFSRKEPKDIESEDLADLPGSSDEDDNVDKEYDASEEIGRESNKLMPGDNSVEAHGDDDLESQLDLSPLTHRNPQLNKYQDYMTQYKKLQDQQRNGDLVNGLIAAGGKIGQSMAGKYSGNFVPDQSGNQMLEKMNARPIQNFEQGMAVEKAGNAMNADAATHDPDSPQSKLVRKYVETRLGLKLDDNVSAADAQMLLKTVGRPTQTKFQKVNGSWTNPSTGQKQRMSAIFDPSTGAYKNADTGESLPGFLAEGLNPYQVVTDPRTGLKSTFNKSSGGGLTNVQPLASAGKATNAQELNAALDPVTRKEMNDKIIPNFNKLTEKTQQRMMHEAPIMAKLQEAQLNPAAYAQLQAEMARFDVGDQRLAQQEFNMFATRHGYKGWGDWVQKNSTGTISPDFAQDFAHTIHNTVQGMQSDLNAQAEKQANLVIGRLPPGQRPDPSVIAPLIYSGYKPSKKKTAGDNGEIKRLTKDGRTAIFDKNKKFLRYEEQPAPSAPDASEESDEEQDEE